MRAVIQRVSKASVTIGHKETASISRGLLVFLGVETGDGSADVQWLAGKIARLRIFPDEQERMNKDIQDIQGDILVVSQFTLNASTKKGNRPSYIRASKPDHAVPMYEAFILQMKDKIQNGVFSGQFGACMQVDLINDGPVTIWMDSKSRE